MNQVGGYSVGIIKTSFGTFRLESKLIKALDYETREKKIISFNMHIGGKNDCIQISIPIDKTKDTAELMWLGTSRGGCEMYNTSISGINTVNLVNIAFSIIKGINHIKKIKLTDSSTITCKNDDIYKDNFLVPLSKYFFLFHQETWYENKFGAELNESDEVKKRYEEIKKNFTDPSKKSDYFDFNNEDLNNSLGEIYYNCKTWKDFLDIIDKYPQDAKCKIVYPWLEKAISEITQTDLHYNATIINLYNNPKLYDVPFQQLSYSKLKGGSRTRKMKRLRVSTPSLSEVYKYKLSKYL